MALLQIFLSSLLFFLLFLLRIATSAEVCPISFCGGSESVAVKFPFQLTNLATTTTSSISRCVYPGFELSCRRNKTIISLPYSGPFIVKSINYNTQTLFINVDPESCLPKRFLNKFSLRDTPFYPDLVVNFTFLKCTSNAMEIAFEYRIVPCLSDENYTVLAMPSRFYDESTLPSSCKKMSSVLVPVSWGYWSGLVDDIRLTWSFPFCAYCEDQDQTCGFKSDTGIDTGCSEPSRSGMSRGTKYGIIIGVGVPGTLCIIGLGCYMCSKVRTYNDRQRLRSNITAELSNSIAPPPPVIVLAGLDRPTIESYPKTLLGESGRLPKPNDNTCPICLCEYQPKETLRTIPECDHYFHADCVDKWLRLNASCPLCRNSPEGSSLITPSSTSASSRSSSGLSP